MLVHCQKALAAIIDPVEIAKMFASANVRTKEGACMLESSSKRRLDLERPSFIAHWSGRGGGRAKKNGMSNFIFSPSYTKYSSDLNLGKSLCICRLFTPGFRFLLNLIKWPARKASGPERHPFDSAEPLTTPLILKHPESGCFADWFLVRNAPPH